jgi:predicted ArsR family transcriptional regulator
MDERNRRILALLSHPSRVQLIQLLGQQAMQTDEMAEKMPIEQAGTVVHLNYLINEGVVQSKRYGRRVRYWLDRERFTEALAELGDSIGVRVQINRAFKQEAPGEADMQSDAAASLQKAAKKATKSNKPKGAKKPAAKAAKKKVTNRATAKKTAAKKKATKKKPTKKKPTKKKATKKRR